MAISEFSNGVKVFVILSMTLMLITEFIFESCCLLLEDATHKTHIYSNDMRRLLINGKSRRAWLFALVIVVFIIFIFVSLLLFLLLLFSMTTFIVSFSLLPSASVM